MELENTQNNALAKLPMLKLGEYEMWEIRINMLILMSLIPNEHQLTFNQYVDAQSMFVAIKARFGGNEATKKTQKALLKQQYENFNATSSESLDSIFNRLQKVVSRLAILGVVTSPEDLNVKFLRSLPSEWDTHVVVWMNKPDFDTMSLDDLYNNFKIVEQKVKKSTGASNGDKNLAFITTSGSSSTNNFNTTNPKVSTATTKVEYFNCHKMGHFAKEYRAPRSNDNRNWNQGSSSKTVKIKDTSEKAMYAIDDVGFDWSNKAEEQVQTNMTLMAFSDSEVHIDKSAKDLNEML
ncbi:hypothetical protein Tco_0826613 [Tanacetum coccineum]